MKWKPMREFWIYWAIVIAVVVVLFAIMKTPDCGLACR